MEVAKSDEVVVRASVRSFVDRLVNFVENRASPSIRTDICHAFLGFFLYRDAYARGYRLTNQAGGVYSLSCAMLC